MKIVNLTQHAASAAQLEQRVVDLPAPKKERLIKLLNFKELPTFEDLEAKAGRIALLAKGYRYAMIGGAPYLMAPLERALNKKGIIPVYAFSKRVSVETVNSDGSTVKTSTFEHAGFIPPVTELAPIPAVATVSGGRNHPKLRLVSIDGTKRKFWGTKIVCSIADVKWESCSNTHCVTIEQVNPSVDFAENVVVLALEGHGYEPATGHKAIFWKQSGGKLLAVVPVGFEYLAHSYKNRRGVTKCYT
jgi:hypothetical protein